MMSPVRSPSGAANLPRALLESLALEGYRQDWLSEAAARRLLGLETRDFAGLNWPHLMV